MRILIVEDDLMALDALGAIVAHLGDEKLLAASYAEAMAAVSTFRPEIVLLDYYLGDGDAVGFMTALRASAALSKAPAVIMLTGEGDMRAKLALYELGIEDYVIKPFAADELMARISVVKRRLHAAAAPFIQIGRNLRYDPIEKKLVGKGDEIALTLNEDRLLRTFLASPGVEIPKTDLFRSVWGDRQVGARNLETLMTYLRKKISAKGLRIECCVDGRYRLLHQDANERP